MEDGFSLPPALRKALRWLLLALLVPLWLIEAVVSAVPSPVPLLTGPAAALLVLLSDRVPLAWRAGIAGAGSWAVTVVALPYQSGSGTGLGVLEMVMLLWLLVPVVRKVRPAPLAMGLGVLIGIAVIAMPLRALPETDALVFCFLLTFVVTGIVGLGSYLRVLDNRRTRAVDAVRHNERLELAHDLHDFVAHHITGIVVQAQAARTVGATSPQEVEPLLLSIETAGAEALASMRRLVQVLREEDSGKRARPEEGFAELAALAERFSRTGPHVWLQVADEARAAQLAPEVTTSMHRVVQEALTNVTRHAPGTLSVAVRVWVDMGSLLVSVVNEPPAHGGARHTPAGGHGGFGIVGLTERVAAVGGSLHAGPLPFGGWEVYARLPVLSMAGAP